MATEIGKQISRARGLKKLSVSELHRLTGISRTVLQGYEAGRYKPGAREIRLLSTALDCSPNKLLLGREEFRNTNAVDKLVSADGDQVANSAKIALLFATLTLEEQRAFLNLLALIAEPRMGREAFAQLLAASDAIYSHFAADDGLESKLGGLVSPEQLSQIEEKVVGEAAPPPPKKRPKRPSKPAD